MIGLFIGSFNPPTRAHLEIALNLKKRYKKIVFVPVNSNSKYLISMKERKNMLNILKKKYSFIDIDDIMDKYSYLNYRIIDLLKAKYQNIEIIIGSDLLLKLDSFDNYLYLLQTYSFCVVSRNLLDTKKVVKEKYYEYLNHFSYLDYHSNISSTLVREYIQKEKDYRTFLDEDVYLYIKNKHLYF